MDENYYKYYEEVKDKCSEEEFIQKMKELEEEQSDNPFKDSINFAESAQSFFINKSEEVESYTSKNTEKLSNLVSGTRGTNVIGRVMTIGSPRGFVTKGNKPGRLCKIEIGDDTGSLIVTLWTENIKLLKNINEGEIIQITNVDIKDGYRGGVEATCARRTTMTHLKEEDYPEFPKYNEEITNIVDIQPDDTVNIIARIIRVSNIRTYEKDGKEGKVASLTLQDATGEIKYSLWRNNTDLIKTMPLEEGMAVKIFKARSNERNGIISLTHWDGRIKVGDYDVPEFTNTLTPIADVREQKNVSILGIVTKIQDPISFTRQDGSEGLVRSIDVKDDTGSVRVTLWNDNAKMTINKKDIIKITGGDGEFDDYSESGYRINTNWNTSFNINPTFEGELMDYLIACKDEIGPIPIAQIQEIDEDGVEVDVMGRIINSADIHEFQRDDGGIGLVRSVDFSDGEGIVRLSFWDDKAKVSYTPGDAYMIENARTKLGMYAVDLNIGKTSRIIKLSEEDARYLPSFETIEKSIYNHKSIADIDEDDTNVIVVGRIVEEFPYREYERDRVIGYVKNIEIADNSGAIRVTFWGEDAKQDFEIGNPIKLQNPSIRFNEDHLVINVSSSTSVLEPSESEISNLPTYDELKVNLYQPKSIEELEEDDTNVIMTGRFTDPSSNRILLSKCPNCNNNIEYLGEDEIVCSFCGDVIDEPRYLLIIPGKLEDDTGEVQVTFFDKLAEDLMGRSKEEIVNIYEQEGDLGALESIVEDLDGLTLEVIGNVGFDQYNEEIRLKPKKILNKYY